jgi:hypothetical protein
MGITESKKTEYRRDWQRITQSDEEPRSRTTGRGGKTQILGSGEK